MHGANRLGGNSLSDLIVFGRRAGIGAADFAEGRTGSPSVDAAEVASVIDEAFAPFGREDGYNPYDVHEELQETMQSLVGIIRTGPELEEALAKLEDLKQQTAKVQVKGGPGLQPGLEPGHRPALHDHHLHRRGPGRAQPQGVPGRAHPGGLPGAGPRDGQGQLRAAPDGRARVPGPDRHRPRAAAGDAARAARPVRGEDTEPHGRDDAGREGDDAGLAGGRRGRRVHRLRHARRRGRGGARRDPPHSGLRRPGPGLPLELQGGQVRLVLGRDQRPAPPHVHDAHGHAARGRAGHGGAR